MILLNSNLTNSTSTNSATQSATYSAQIISILTLNSIGTFVFFIMFVALLILLIVQWKTMVRNKKFMTIVLIITCLNQFVHQACGLVGYLTSFLNGPPPLGGVFLGLEFAGYLLNLTLCLDCQAIITIAFYGVYFNESQSWMRNSKGNSIFRNFVKYSSIAIVAIFNLQLLLSLPFAFIYSILLKVDILSTTQANTLRQFTGIFHPTLGALISVSFLYFCVLNLFLSISLIRKLLHKQNQNIITIQKRNCCRKLIIMNIGQVIMALINVIGIIIMGISYVIPLAMFVVAVATHRIAIFLFCVFMIFSFGPLDDVSELGDQLIQTMKRKSLSIKDDIKLKDVQAQVSVSNKPEESKI